MIPRVVYARSNSAVQTTISAFSEDTPFLFDEDKELTALLARPKLEMNEFQIDNIIQPLQIGKDGVVRRTKIPRLFKRSTAPMIRHLLQQIEENPESESELVRTMARKMIPGLDDETYTSLFTDPIRYPFQVLSAAFKLVDDEDHAEEDVNIILTLNNFMYIVNDKRTIKCTTELWDQLNPDRELSIIRGGKAYAIITIKKIIEEKKYRRTKRLSPITFETVPEPVLVDLAIDGEDDITDILTSDDTSFVDLVLSLPAITPAEANELLTILHFRGLLFPYVRSKMCEMQLSDPIGTRAWPELLGRFIFLLDPRWCYINAQLLKKNDVMAVFRHIKQLGGGALYVLQTALAALAEIRGCDLSLFFWTLLFLSVLPNVTLAKSAASGAKLREKMVALWKELQKKGPDSRTKVATRDTVEYILGLTEFNMDAPRMSEDAFFRSIFVKHLQSALTILDVIPARREESSPLFFPVVLAIETALEQARKKPADGAGSSEFYDSESTTSAGGMLSDFVSRMKAGGSVRSAIESDALSSEASYSSKHSKLSSKHSKLSSEYSNLSENSKKSKSSKISSKRSEKESSVFPSIPEVFSSQESSNFVSGAQIDSAAASSSSRSLQSRKKSKASNSNKPLVVHAEKCVSFDEDSASDFSAMESAAKTYSQRMSSASGRSGK